MDLQYCQAANKLYSIHDDTFKMVSPAQRNTLQVCHCSCRHDAGLNPNSGCMHGRSLPSVLSTGLVCAQNLVACMQVVDVEQQAFVARATEFSEECELLCFAPVGDAAGDWGNELIAGAVHGSGSPLSKHCHHLISWLGSIFLCARSCIILREGSVSWCCCLEPGARVRVNKCGLSGEAVRCRFLPDVLPHRPALALLPQGHNSHSRPVHVRPARQHQHGNFPVSDKPAPLLIVPGACLCAHRVPHAYVSWKALHLMCNKHAVVSHAWHAGSQVCFSSILLCRCSALARITGACIPASAAPGAPTSSPVMWASLSACGTAGKLQLLAWSWEQQQTPHFHTACWAAQLVLLVKQSVYNANLIRL